MKHLFLTYFAFNFIFSVANATSADPTGVPFDHGHEKLTKILKEYVVAKGPVSQVRYKALKRDNAQLTSYLGGLSAVSRKEFDGWSKNTQMAFLINAYNGFTLKLIVDHYPVDSIKDIGSFFSSPWKKEFFTLLGQKMNLDHIEHGLLRKMYLEPRIHFAVNCASIGCPMLRKEAYIENKLEEQLEEQAKLFLRDKTRNTIIEKDKEIRISKIFDWFEEDFEKSGGTVAKFVAKYMIDDPMVQKQIADGSYKIRFHSYDWGLNIAP